MIMVMQLLRHFGVHWWCSTVTGGVIGSDMALTLLGSCAPSRWLLFSLLFQGVSELFHEMVNRNTQLIMWFLFWECIIWPGFWWDWLDAYTHSTYVTLAFQRCDHLDYHLGCGDQVTACLQCAGSGTHQRERCAKIALSAKWLKGISHVASDTSSVPVVHIWLQCQSPRSLLSVQGTCVSAHCSTQIPLSHLIFKSACHLTHTYVIMSFDTLVIMSFNTLVSSCHLNTHMSSCHLIHVIWCTCLRAHQLSWFLLNWS